MYTRDSCLNNHLSDVLLYGAQMACFSMGDFAQHADDKSIQNFGFVALCTLTFESIPISGTPDFYCYPLAVANYGMTKQGQLGTIRCSANEDVKEDNLICSTVIGLA